MRSASCRLVVVVAIGLSLSACSRKTETPASPAFATPEAAVDALGRAVASRNLADVLTLFGTDGKELVDTADTAAARQNRGVFMAAMAEQWRLVDEPNRKVLIVGHEEWPFPVPLVKNADGWRFDTAAGKDEIVSRRIGRNELAAIRTSLAYVAAQRRYAAIGHDDQPAGVYAVTIRSEAGRHNGLYWPPERGRRSPLGDLLQEAEQRGADGGHGPSPFHGYFFRILTGQGAGAPGGARNYIVGGRMTGGFALVAWPAQYDVTGIMTFLVNQDGVVQQNDLGPDTAAAVARITQYNPDASWTAVE